MSYDTFNIPRRPIDKGARKMLSSVTFDLTAENAQEALAITEKLKGAGMLARGTSPMEAASLIIERISKKEKIQLVEDQEVVKLKKVEIDTKREMAKFYKEQTRMNAARRDEQHRQIHEKNMSYYACFSAVAKDVLPPADYSIIVDLAMAERDRRQKAK